MGLTSRLAHAFNAFMGRDPTSHRSYKQSFSYRPDRTRLRRGNERTIVTAVITRIGIDIAAINMYHAQLDQNGRFIGTINSGMNECLTLSANKDQTGRACRQDMGMSICDEGVIAIVPTVTTVNPAKGAFDILEWRVAKILAWYPNEVLVHVYNEDTGLYEDLLIAKSSVAIVENPLYAVMNEPNSTLQRLIQKLTMLDVVDEQTSSGKLNMIIQLPYTVKTEARKQQAEERTKDLEMQLETSKYGIAYIDGTEKVTQIGRALENNLLAQIDYLTSMLYSQLGITKEVMEGKASEAEMLNYYNRTIEPILSAIVDEMKRKFLTRNARTRGQTIAFFREPFKLVPITSMAELADKLTRNAVLSSNEVRQILGFKPVQDPKADELSNKNMPDTGNSPMTGPTQSILSRYAKTPLEEDMGEVEDQSYEEPDEVMNNV